MDLGAVGAAAGPWDPGPTTMGANPIRHGSLEQTGSGSFLGSYLDSMSATGTTPRPSPRRTPPRSPRPRSPMPQDDDDYNDRRSEGRDRRHDDEPIGMGFRINACETSLRDHQAETAAQRIAIQQLTDEVRKQMGERESHGQRLDKVFELVDLRFRESQQSTQTLSDASRDKIESLTAQLNSTAHGLAARIE